MTRFCGRSVNDMCADKIRSSKHSVTSNDILFVDEDEKTKTQEQNLRLKCVGFVHGNSELAPGRLSAHLLFGGSYEYAHG